MVVRRLENPSPYKSWGLLKTVVLGVPSFGLLPLVMWPARFREYVLDESQAMQELAQWAKLRGRQPAAVGPLLSAAEETSSRPVTFIMSLILAALVVGLAAIQFTHTPFSWGHVLSWTYLNATWHPAAMCGAKFIHRIWVIALSVGFAVQWLHVRAHISAVRQFVNRFNPVAAAEALPAIRFPDSGSVLGTVLWLFVAVALARFGAWWGIPMVLAGMAQRRYTRVSGNVVRGQLASRVRDIVTRRQPPILIAPMPVMARRCGNPRCLAALRPVARFCSRCGSATMDGLT